MAYHAEPPPIPRRVPMRGLALGGAVLALLFLGVIVLPVWVWYWCRIEPNAGEFAVLIRKTGDDLKPGEILATKPGQKGIQLEVLAEGRYFYNPYTWGWEIHPITDIPPGKLGVVTRQYGQDLPPGQLLVKGSLATGKEQVQQEDYRGILEGVMPPGKYRINPYAYLVEMFDAITIRPGYVGVVTSLVGSDVLTTELKPAQRNTFMVEDGLKGVQAQVYEPGVYYLNPYRYNFAEVNVQSQRFEMSGADAIKFLTNDGFEITAEGTVEYRLEREETALLTHRVGDLEDIVNKLVLPSARGFGRIEGSKKSAVEFIIGESRKEFQDKLETHLTAACATWGVSIQSVLIRNIVPDESVSKIIRERELAVQVARRLDQEIEQAKTKATLEEQRALAEQNKAKVTAETAKIRARIGAEQQQEVALTAAERELAVAEIDLKAAQFTADAMTLDATAKQAVIRLQNEADAGVIAEQVKAFGSGAALARYFFYRKLGPRIGGILTSDGPEGLGDILRGYAAPPLAGKKEVAR